MKEHLRFAAPYWHVMRNVLADPFGGGTAQMPWDDGSDSVENALARVDVFWNFSKKWGSIIIAGMIVILLPNSTIYLPPMPPSTR